MICFKNPINTRGGGGHLYVRLDIILVKGLSKHTLSMYFSVIKIDAFLHAFPLIYPSRPFQNLPLWPKTHPFLQFCTFLHPLNDVGAYIAWSWKSTLIMWIFYEDDIQPEIQVAPRDQHTHTLCVSTRHTCLRKVLRNAHIANQGNTENCCFQRMDMDWQNRK